MGNREAAEELGNREAGEEVGNREAGEEVGNRETGEECQEKRQENSARRQERLPRSLTAISSARTWFCSMNLVIVSFFIQIILFILIFFFAICKSQWSSMYI